MPYVVHYRCNNISAHEKCLRGQRLHRKQKKCMLDNAGEISERRDGGSCDFASTGDTFASFFIEGRTKLARAEEAVRASFFKALVLNIPPMKYESFVIQESCKKIEKRPKDSTTEALQKA